MSHESSARRHGDCLQLPGEEMTAASDPSELDVQQQPKTRRKKRRRVHRRQQRVLAEEMEQAPTSKRKRMNRPVGITASISQLSIVPPSSKRPRATTTEVPAKVVPDYLKVPDRVLKTMLAAALNGGEAIVQLLDTTEKLQYARLYAQLVNDVCFLKLKQEHHEQCYHVVHDARVWSSGLSKEMIKENHLQRIQFITEENMERRRQTMAEALKLAEEALDQHKQLGMHQTIDPHQLSSMVFAFVRKSQSKLSAEFKRKISLVQWDANDIQLVQAFYEWKPTEEQVLDSKRDSNQHVYLDV